MSEFIDTLSPEQLEAVRVLWIETLQRIRESKPALSAVLETARVIPIDSYTWRILFRRPFEVEQARRQQDFIKAALSEMAERPMVVHLEEGSNATPLPQARLEPQKAKVPDNLIPISQVYETALAKWDLQRRAIQWYATEDFIPKPRHLGREAYYDKRTIYSYFSLLHILTRKKFSFSLNQVRDVIKKLEQIKAIKTPTGKKQPAIIAAETFLLNHNQYESQIWAIYGRASVDGSHSLSGEYSVRLEAVRTYIKDGLRAAPDRVRTLLRMTMLDIEAEVEAQEKIEEVPF